MDIRYELLDNNNKDILEIEMLRCEAFNIKELVKDSYYYKKIKDGDMVVVKCYLDDKLVGGVYVTNSYSSLFIDQIFIRPKYQRNGLHIGSRLLNYVLENKNIFEDYFNKKFSVSRLENRCQDEFYNYMGYKNENNLMDTMKRRI